MDDGLTEETTTRRRFTPAASPSTSPVRLQIWAAACDFAVDGHTQKISEVLANNRFHTSARLVELFWLRRECGKERIAAALRTEISEASLQSGRTTVNR